MHSRVSRRFLPNAVKLVILMGICASATPVHAQTAPAPAAAQPVSHKLNPEELAQLLAPIALYPDALIALILPASTVPSDVVLGARYLAANGNPDLADQQPWDESVKSLLRYPEVLTWLDQNLEWTASVGEAFVEQPADVMNAVQALRQQAKAAGNLQDTPQQKVVVEEEVVRIVPADPEVIYVPQYDPQVVYVQSYSPAPLVTFGIGCAVGAWLAYDFDWNRCRFYHGNWRGWDRGGNHGWNGNQGGNQINVVNINNANPWIPSANGQRQTNQRQRNNNGNARYVSARPAAPQQQAVVGSAASLSGPSVRFNPAAQTALPRPSAPQRLDGGKGAGHVRPVNPAGTLPSIPVTPDAPNIVPDGPHFRKPGAANAPANPGATGNEPTPGLPQAPLKAPDKPLVPEVLPAIQSGTEAPRVAPESPKPAWHAAVPTAAPKVKGQLTDPTRNSTPETAHSQRPAHTATPSATPASARPTVMPSAPVPVQPGPAAERVIQPTQTRHTEIVTESPAKKTPAARPVSQPKQPAPEVRQERTLVQPQQQIVTERQQVQPQRQQAQERQLVQPQRQPVVERQIAQPQRQQVPERQLRPVAPAKQQSAFSQPSANSPAKPSAAPAATPAGKKKTTDDKKTE